MNKKDWRSWVRGEVRFYVAAWTPVYIVSDCLICSNPVAYYRGMIFLNERLKSRCDQYAFEVLHYDIFQLKIDLALRLEVRLAGV